MLDLTRDNRAFADTAEPICTFHIHRHPSGDQRITGRLRRGYGNFLPVCPFNFERKILTLRQLRQRKELGMQRHFWIPNRTGML